MADSLTPEVIAQIVSFLEGLQATKTLALAASTLYIWDYVITVDQEIEYFWAGLWNMSRMLFLCNRYLTPVTLILGLVCFYTPGLSVQFCTAAVKVELTLNVIGFGILQAVLVIRVWHLFWHSKSARTIILACYSASTAATLFFLSRALKDLQPTGFQLPGYSIVGCTNPPPGGFWHTFLPLLILHTILFIFTTVRAMQNKRPLFHTPIMKRLLRDGGLCYLAVVLSVGFSAIGAFLTHVPSVNLPAVFGNFMLTVCTISVSRLMLSIRSLAAHLGSNEAWLLNNAELSRVPWRMGDHEGEIIVEIDGAYHEDMRTTPTSDPRYENSELPTELSRVVC